MYHKFSTTESDFLTVTTQQFEEQLKYLQTAGYQFITSLELLDFYTQNKPLPPKSVLLTFDDGGASAYTIIADLLEERGWRGHFFITTDFIGRPAFLTAPQIRALHGRGHIIGSHSCSHPPRISHLPPARILEEWKGSTEKLSGILGAGVNTASVPAGFYSPRVAAAAAAAGINVLFNSEPTLRVRQVEECRVAGRFGLQQSDPAKRAAALASAAPGPRFKQWAFWNAKKVVKAVGGEVWLSFRKRVLSR